MPLMRGVTDEPVVSEHPRSLQHVWVAGQHGATFPCREILRGEERQGRQIRKRSDRPALKG
jgi:hypothetical protein